MNHGLAEPGGPLERNKLDPAVQDSGMCPNCEVMRDFISSPGRYAPSPAGTAVLEITRKIAEGLGSVPLNANRRALVGHLSMLEG